ncbi:hypothetical protein DVH26_04925 [Paenibacillus sp. H1-7]|uniref:hypothetical protein n=1 Tax=Paenibacillus sp. H1-7 TaxID=2282849 RepID=UPI001EF86BDB|nr:hypothetical protein [Paenibacillus sp. H1-7]ULL13845.1 hypothetical protein DVH26_04925 [Paenibacillus sp. H1-7]
MAVIIWIIVIFSLCTTLLTIIMLVRGLRDRREQNLQRKAILEGGISAQAVINSIQQTNVQVDDQPEVLLDLTVTMQNDTILHTVVKTVIPIIHIPAFQKGNVIEVKYMTINNEQRFEVVDAYLP